MRKKMKKSAATISEQKLLCENLSFAGSEAYKRLRMNLLLSFPDEQKCRVIGVTSSNRGDGKSVTSINLAYTLSETGKKTLLIEADMRLPNHARRLGLAETPGLSNLLVDLAKQSEVLQNVPVQECFHVITAGDVPPNPAELLGSNRMKNCVEEFSSQYDYILIETPPVNIVSDACIVANVLDGVLLLVRQDSSKKDEVKRAVTRLQLTGAKLLGFILNDATLDKQKSYSYYG